LGNTNGAEGIGPMGLSNQLTVDESVQTDIKGANPGAPKNGRIGQRKGE